MKKIKRIRDLNKIGGYFKTSSGISAGEHGYDFSLNNYSNSSTDAEIEVLFDNIAERLIDLCLLYTSPSPRDQRGSRMPSSA